MSDEVYNTPWSIGAKFWIPTRSIAEATYVNQRGERAQWAIPSARFYTATMVLRHEDHPHLIPLKYFTTLGMLSNEFDGICGSMDITPCATRCRPWFIAGPANCGSNFRLYATREEAVAVAVALLEDEKDAYLHRHAWIMQQTRLQESK